MTFRDIISKIFTPLRQSASPSLIKLIEHTNIVAEAGEILHHLLTSDPFDREILHDKIVFLEKKADDIQREGVDIIYNAFFLPIDRSMLLRAFEISDDIADVIRKTSYELTKSQQPATEYNLIAALAIKDETKLMAQLATLMSSMEKNRSEIRKTISRIHYHEKEADRAYRDTFEAHFDPAKISGTCQNAISVMLDMRITEKLEAIADKCEDFAHECARILSDYV